jgi:Nucleotidyltransferase of unknown function (DUF6036)
MKRYNRVELVAFLRGIDEELSGPVELIIIGGAAASLRYGATSTTRDIDTWNTIPATVHAAAERARAKTKLEIPIEQASVADAPYHYEDRMRRVPLKLQNLRVRVPERHDLVLMKIIRGDRHDEDVIAEIHAKHPLDPDLLIDRFENEMGHVIKDERILRQQFRLLVGRLFGPDAAKQVRAKRLPSNDPRL